MLKNLIFSASLLLTLFSCNNKEILEQADNPLDGGRYFIEHFMQGDIIKAQQYLLIDAKNQAYFDQQSKDYFALDKEGRSQLRQASIQINEVKALDSNSSVIYYQHSADTTARWIKVVRTPDGWKVDLKYSYGPKL
ncbi:MAG: hypothetical protein RLZ56_405 [Bacteroidota bacterium]|jgi:uncharacterized lipoprotein NlpE involved in copper resistance